MNNASGTADGYAGMDGSAVVRLLRWLFWEEPRWILQSALGVLVWFGRLLRDPFRKKEAREAEPRERLLQSGPMNWTFFLLLIALLAIGIVMMFSASYVSAQKKEGNPWHFLVRQLIFAAIGLVAMWIVSHVRLEFLSKYNGIFYVIALVLLVIVLIHPHIIPGKEKFKRWLEVPGTDITFQPSEIAKFALILYLASALERNQRAIRTQATAIFPYVLPVMIFMVLIYFENHNSALIIVATLVLVMFFCGGAKRGWFLLLALFAVIAAIWFFSNLDRLTAITQDGDYAYKRVAVWIKLLTGAELSREDMQGDAWQSLQSLYAVGSGGLFGLGFGQSKQKHLYLPEPQNDFVFAIVCEELGFVRSALIILAFLVLVGVGIFIGMQCKNRFGQLAAIGLSFKIGLQAALNFAVVTSLIPNTGISLPLFSYGGTALVMQLVELGVILAVARDNGRRSSHALR
ncbi:MAG: cell division protein FtsW [Clostridia bacterium]|nr:cell division protein FtsW [Clostridia bacterium]